MATQSTKFKGLVPPVGLEPTLPKEPDFESGASTNSTTGAQHIRLKSPDHNELKKRCKQKGGCRVRLERGLETYEKTFFNIVSVCDTLCFLIATLKAVIATFGVLSCIEMSPRR